MLTKCDQGILKDICYYTYLLGFPIGLAGSIQLINLPTKRQKTTFDYYG